jgi:hypothetical protein
MRELEELKTAALNALQSVEYEHLDEEQSKLFIFQPLVGHALTEMPAPFAFHPQLICDFFKGRRCSPSSLAAMQIKSERQPHASSSSWITAPG